MKLFKKRKETNMKSQNYISINGQKIEIPHDKLEEIKRALGVHKSTRLADKKVGETAKIGPYEFIVLEQSGDTTALILKELFKENVKFGSNNDYRGSNVQKICREFAKELESIVGADNLIEHTVDLASDDGLKDYSTIKENASLLTTDLYRRYVDVLDMDRLDKYYWLATPYSTPRHEGTSWVKCVSPRGDINNDDCNYDFIGVRPFCILKSDIFVS